MTGSRNVSIIHVAGPLRAPMTAKVRHQVQALLRRGERQILVNLAGVSGLDAAGLGELVGAYNMASAVDGVLRITHPTRIVREFLRRVGLLDLLTGDSPGPRVRDHHNLPFR